MVARRPKNRLAKLSQFKGKVSQMSNENACTALDPTTTFQLATKFSCKNSLQRRTLADRPERAAMSQKEKLLERLKGRPKDFTWSELERILNGLGYEQERNTGSSRKFFNPSTGALICIHQPHPRDILKSYQVRDILNHLKETGTL